MADSLVSTGFVAFAATSLLFLAACDPAVGDSEGSSSSTGGPSTSTSDPQTSGPPMTSSTTTSDPPMTSSTTDAPTTTSTDSSSTSDTGSSSSTGVEGDCVDEDIGSAVGSGLASGSNEDQGDDFQLRYCDGGASTSSTSAGTDPSESGTTGLGTTGGFGTTGFADTGNFGTTGDFGDGDDYVISWSPPAAGQYIIDTFGSDIDTVLSVVPPECGSSSTVCNDDCNDLQSGLVYEASEGETVYVVVEGYGGRRGSFVLNITESSELECDSYGTSTGGSTTTFGTSVGTITD